MKKTRNWLASLAFAFATTVHAGQYSDLWFNPAESGWGVNVVQQAETAFVTLFAYGQDGKPVWYVAPSANIVAFASTGPIFSGRQLQTIGESRVFVPTQLYKVVYLPSRQLAFAVVVENVPTDDYAMKTVHELEAMSGLQFPGIPEALKDKRLGGLKGV